MYLVVAFHAGLVRFEGGFVGVDVFFVLSGFLITRLLIVEHASSGRIDLMAFYARRARRLLPAAWAALLITALAYAAFSNPVERAVALDDARSAVFYFANWHFIGEGQDYFADSISSSPFLHLWSLAAFGHLGKIDAIFEIAAYAANVGDEGIEAILCVDQIDELMRLPYIGPATSRHLLKNLGVQVAKPDRHLIRIADAAGVGVADLCEALAHAVEDTVAVVDLVLWRWSTIHWPCQFDECGGLPH